MGGHVELGLLLEKQTAVADDYEIAASARPAGREDLPRQADFG